MESTVAIRPALLRRAILLAGASIAWMLVEGGVAVGAGIAAGSVALLGFGIDSFIELASAVVVGWRVLEERRGASAERVERVERVASRFAAALLLALAAYIVVEASRRLLGYGNRAEGSVVGIAITILALIVMPVLGRMKLRTAAALGSGALRAEGYETVACAWLALATVLGLAFNAAFGWWWADPVAALVLVPLMAREGLRAWCGVCRRCGSGERDASAP
jgi:divalent metal cation (Fe/Co/Zn/Cd) transporter